MMTTYQVSYVVNAVVNIPLTLTAVLGNAVILDGLRRTSSLHSPSKALLVGLAFSDLVVGLFCQPLHIAYLLSCALQIGAPSTWAYSVPFVFVLMSLLTMTSISTDRFLALRLRCRYREVVTLRRVKLILCSIWMTGGLLVLLKLRGFEAFYGFFSAALVAVCVFISSLTFANIYRVLSLQCVRVSHSQQRSNRKIKNALSAIRYRKRIRNAVFIFAALLIGFLPYFGLLVSRTIGLTNRCVQVMLGFVETLVLLNSSLNPFLYCWRTSEVRQSVRQSVRHMVGCSFLWKNRGEEENESKIETEKTSVPVNDEGEKNESKEDTVREEGRRPHQEQEQAATEDNDGDGDDNNNINEFDDDNNKEDNDDDEKQQDDDEEEKGFDDDDEKGDDDKDSEQEEDGEGEEDDE